MNQKQMLLARNSYTYVPARLVVATSGEQRPIISNGLRLAPALPAKDWYSDEQLRARYSSIELDEFHRRLLNSDHDEQVLHGLLSVVFWGFASGADGRIRAPYARARVSWLCDGKKGFRKQHARQQIAHVRAARDLSKADRMGDALLEAMNIQHVGMSFASKILMFLAPEQAGVYDDVISVRLSSSTDDSLRALGGMAKSGSKKRQTDTYVRWCDWLRNTASNLNADGRKWQDWNGVEHSWRAVDAERAFFALGRDLHQVRPKRHAPAPSSGTK